MSDVARGPVVAGAGPAGTLGSGSAEAGSMGGSVSRPRFPCFDGLRAIAVLFAIMTHVGFVTGASALARYGAYTARLDVGIVVFFLISGYLLYYSYVADNFDDRPPMRAVAFWWRRLLRIVPAYWLALTGLVVLFGLHLSGLHDVVVYYGFLQIYDTHRFLGGIPQAWTLCVEVSFYAVLPAYAWLMRHATARRTMESRLRIELLGVAALIALCYVYRSAVYALDGRHAVGRIATHWLPGYLDLFALGMGLAAVRAYVARRGSGRMIDRIGRVPWLWWLLAAVSFWAIAERIGLPRSPQPSATPIGWLADEQQILQSLFAAFLCLPAIFGPQDRGLVRGFLRSRPVAYLGVVSYGVYLWHEGWLDKFMRWTGRPNVTQLNAVTHYSGSTFPLILVLTVAASLVTATIGYYLVERPILRWKDRVPHLSLARRGAVL
jgi:peptidoglycan/LPS O-acetylase OafA/YrhL